MVRKNLANIVSILGVLPLCLLFREHGFQYLLPLIVYNNVMDDLDGVLAVKLNIGSRFGALLDNVCDAISHAMFMMIVGTHFFQEIGSAQTGFSFLGLVCLTACLLATIAITVRGVARLDPDFSKKSGSPTNELIRHVFFILLLSQSFEFDPTWCLILASVFHSISMLAPFKMPYLIRGLSKSATAIGFVNVALLLAWLSPMAAPLIAALFIVTYLASFAVGGFSWLRNERPER